MVPLLTQVGDTAERERSADQTVQHGWSRSTPALHIKKRLHRRQGSALTDFHTRCPHRLLPAKTRAFVDFVVEAFARERLAQRFSAVRRG
jgi:hypothetical protein